MKAFSFIELKDGKGVYNLGPSVSILEDPKGNLNIENVSGKSSKLKFFKSKKDVPNFGIRPSAFWIRIDVKNFSNINQWFLSLDYHYLDNVQFYRFNKGKWNLYQTGDRFKFKQREVPHRGFVFKIKPKGETTYFLRLKSRGSIQIPLKIYSPSSFYEHESVVHYGFGIFYGFLIVMIFYNLFVFFSTKNIAYIYYVVFLASFYVIMMSMNGFGFQFLFPNIPYLQNEGIPLMGLVVAIACGLFTHSYLDLKTTPKISYALKGFNVISALFLLFARWIPYTFILRFVLLFVLVGFGIILTGVFFKVRARYRPSYFYILAFASFILGITFKVLNNMGILPSIFIFTQGLYIGGAAQVILLALGLADIINSLKKDALIKAEKLSIAREQLIEANKNLEDKVRQRTVDLSSALNDISNLLDNMRQAVFTANKEGVILSPVSIFSENIFQLNIENKKVNETIFKDIDKHSELFSSIQFSYSVIFGADDLQWEMVKDNFPTRILFKKEDETEKILKVSYIPLWDKEGLLERVMYVVEDITEIESLEKEMEDQKTASLKNIQILQELASNKKEDLVSFFTTMTQTSLDCLYSTKKMRSQIEKIEEISDLSLFFRNIHTIKGTARVFNLGYISASAHEIENKLVLIIDKKERQEDVFWEDVNELVQGMYILQGQVNEYLKAAKNVFSIEFEDDIRFREKLHDQVKNLEYGTIQLFMGETLLENKNFDVIESFFKKKGFKEKLIEDLKNLSHSLKGLSRGMDERELSEEVHRFEGGLLIIENPFEEGDVEKIDELLLGPLRKIKNLSFNIYLNSKNFKIYEKNTEQWTSILIDFYEIGIMLENSDEEELLQKIYNLHAKSISLELEYFPGILRVLYVFVEEKNINRDVILEKIKRGWDYLIFFASLDNNRRYSSVEETTIFRVIKEREDVRDLDFLHDESIFIHFIKKIGTNYSEVLANMADILNISYERLIRDFLPQSDLTKVINEMFYEFKKGFSLRIVESLENFYNGQEEFFGKFKKIFCDEDIFSGQNYLRNIDLLQVLNSFCVDMDGTEEQMKPKTYDVLVENYNECFDNFLNLTENGEVLSLDILNKNFEKLLHLPLKHSLFKFGSIVKDISKSLGKKIYFKVLGDEGSLEKDRLNRLQEIMVHLVRNSIDHGIEIPSQRISRGKEETGTIEIDCLDKKDGTFEVKLKDDGGGIDLNKIMAKVLEENLVSKEKLEQMGEGEKLDLIFLPNFSTKEEVSEISGRGVGMDVVKRNLDNLGATLDVKTVKDKGTEFIINIVLDKKSDSKKIL